MKLTSTLLCGAVASLAWAGAPSLDFQGFQAFPVAPEKVAPVKSHQASLQENFAFSLPEGALITEIPEGAVETPYSGRGQVFYTQSDTDYVYEKPADGWMYKIYSYEDNNDIYLKNPLIDYMSETYLKGTMSVDKQTMTFTLPQYLCPVPQNEGYFFILSQLKLNKSANGEYYYAPIEDGYTNVMKFTIDAGSGCWVEEQPEMINADGVDLPEYINGVLLVVENEVQWIGDGDYYKTLTAFNETATALPDGLTTERWSMKSNDYQTLLVNVAIDKENGKVYVGKLSREFPDSFIVGTISGDEGEEVITFPSMQFIGANENINYYTYFMACSNDSYQDDEEGWQVVFNLQDKAVCDYYPNDEKGPNFAYDKIFLINCGCATMDYVDYYNMPQFNWIDPSIALQNPKDPKWGRITEYSSDYKVGYWWITIYSCDVNGTVLDPANLFFNIWVDGELYKLDPSEYTDLTEEVADIPYEYENYDTFHQYNGDLHVIPFTRQDIKFGTPMEVQTIYRDTENNIELRSQKVAYDWETLSFVAETLAGAEVASVVYTDLAGVRVANPANGIYLKTVTYTDGTVKTVKVALK